MKKHNTFTFKGLNDIRIFCQSWHSPEEPQAVIIISHGYAEHSGRYQHVAEYFLQKGYAVYALDHRGHGCSDGPRADVINFENYLIDLKTFLDIIKGQEENRSIFLVGHSMGGAIATLFAARYGLKLDGVITSGVGFWDFERIPPKVILNFLNFIAQIAPRIPVISLPPRYLSRDQKVVDDYKSDPLNYVGKVCSRMGVQLLCATSLGKTEASNIKLPVLILHGTSDRLSAPKVSKMLYERVASPDKTLKYYDGLYHEIFNEPEKEQVFEDMADWINAYLAKVAN